MLNLPVIITPLRTYLYGQTSFWMEGICLQHFSIEYLEKQFFENCRREIDNTTFASAFFCDVKQFELERLIYEGEVSKWKEIKLLRRCRVWESIITLINKSCWTISTKWEGTNATDTKEWSCHEGFLH